MPNKKSSLPPASLMVWTVNDVVIENPGILEEQFHDIRFAGFEGVTVYVRCSRYSWNDKPARKALRRIGDLCREYSMQYWLGPDPRFVSHELTKRSQGLEVIAFGDNTRADVFPHFAPVDDGVFSLRCGNTARHVHTLTDVAVEFHPLGILRAYAVPADADVFEDDTVIDITKDAQFYYNARDRYVEAFGRFYPPDGRPWKVIAFFRFRTNHVDFSDRSHMRAYNEMLHGLEKDGIVLDGMIWDEPGYTCTYGTLPYSKAIRKTFKKKARHSLKGDLWKLALDAADGSHVDVRNRYYRVIQEQVNDAQLESNKHARRLWGKDVVAGIHDTWHFESADMCDMNHGSLDLWEALPTKSGGFVDLGTINELRDPDSPYYANLAAMNVIGASLGRWSERRFAMNNLWTVGDDDGEGWHRSVMDHCVNSMAVFGTRWLAHAYGPAGTVGQERSFLGSPPLPGYPDHSTWSTYPEWNQLLKEHCELVEDALPFANVLVVYPVETMYALADTRADKAARDVFNLILALVDAHFHVDVLSAKQIRKQKSEIRITAAGQVSGIQNSEFKSQNMSRAESRDAPFGPGKGRDAERRFSIPADGLVYDAVIYPHPQIISKKLLPLLEQSVGNLIYVFGTPEKTDRNKAVSVAADKVATTSDEIVAWLETREVPHAIEAPDSSWASLSFVKSGAVVTLAPARHGDSYEGTVSYGGRSIALEEQKGLTRVLFPEGGEPEVLRVRSQKSEVRPEIGDIRPQ